MNKETLLSFNHEKLAEVALAAINMQNLPTIIDALHQASEDYNTKSWLYFFPGRTKELAILQQILQQLLDSQQNITLEGKSLFDVLQDFFKEGAFKSTSLNVIFLRNILILESKHEFSDIEKQTINDHLALAREQILQLLDNAKNNFLIEAISEKLRISSVDSDETVETNAVAENNQQDLCGKNHKTPVNQKNSMSNVSMVGTNSQAINTLLFTPEAHNVSAAIPSALPQSKVILPKSWLARAKSSEGAKIIFGEEGLTEQAVSSYSSESTTTKVSNFKSSEKNTQVQEKTDNLNDSSGMMHLLLLSDLVQNIRNTGKEIITQLNEPNNEDNQQNMEIVRQFGVDPFGMY
jgi:hypothetical protein